MTATPLPSHYTLGQRAAVGVEMLPALQQAAREQSLSNPVLPGAPKPRGRRPDSTELAAVLVRVGATTIHYAKKVLEQDAHLFDRIKKGELTVGQAYRLVNGKQAHRRSGSQPREKRVSDIRQLASEENRADQIASMIGISTERVRELAHSAAITLPDNLLGKRPKIKAQRVIEETVSTLEGLGTRTAHRLWRPSRMH